LHPKFLKAKGRCRWASLTPLCPWGRRYRPLTTTPSPPLPRSSGFRWGRPYLLSTPLSLPWKLPVFTGKDSIEMMEMACFWLPLPRFAAPQPLPGVRRFTPVPIYRPKTPVFWALLSPEDCDVWVGWLTYQARYVRVTIPRRAMHASFGSSCHLSAKHRLLDTAG